MYIVNKAPNFKSLFEQIILCMWLLSSRTKYQAFLMSKILMFVLVFNLIIRGTLGQVRFAFAFHVHTIFNIPQIPIRKLSFNSVENERFLKVIYDPENETHLGAFSYEVFENIPVVLIRCSLEKDGHKYVENEVNACNFFKKQRVNFLITYFKKHIFEYYNLKRLRCPVLPGKFVLARARPKITSADDFLPSFIPRGGLLEIRCRSETIIRKRRVYLSNSTEIFEFY